MEGVAAEWSGFCARFAPECWVANGRANVDAETVAAIDEEVRAALIGTGSDG
jgi:hypothetical protein